MPVTTNEGLSTLRNVVSDGSLGPFTVGTFKIITGVLPPSTTEATFTPADVPKGKTSTSLGELLISFQGLPRAKPKGHPLKSAEVLYYLPEQVAHSTEQNKWVDMKLQLSGTNHIHLK